jgi:catechol 2,3-dioxygenase-like lactoylglutathione lyase family enzyme
LIELTLTNRGEWSVFPEATGVLLQWRERAEEATGGKFAEHWSKTVEECVRLLEVALKGIKAGALSLDFQVLSDLGCFDKRQNGAGTVCAAASLFIASKYAPDPLNGLSEAATAKGADTDTLASMAGAIFGAVSGTEWLQTYRPQLQDEKYIGELAELVSGASRGGDSDTKLPDRIPKPRLAINSLYESLMQSKKSDVIGLPDGRQATVEGITPVIVHTESLRGQIWKLKTGDGQTIYIKRLQRNPKKPGKEPDLISDDRQREPGQEMRLSSNVRAVKLMVSNLERSRRFYGETLGLRVVRETKNLVNFGGVLSLVPADYSNELGMYEEVVTRTKCIICLETSELESCRERVRRISETRATPIVERAGRRLFRCRDFDENILEIFEVPRSDFSLDPS